MPRFAPVISTVLPSSVVPSFIFQASLVISSLDTREPLDPSLACSRLSCQACFPVKSLVPLGFVSECTQGQRGFLPRDRSVGSDHGRSDELRRTQVAPHPGLSVDLRSRSIVPTAGAARRLPVG